MKITEVYIIFKTHLDVGFTDFSANVTEKYINQFIPGVFKLNDNNFVWTTGSWLIDEFLSKADESGVAEMESAIAAGRISWHGLPFTMHSEFMNTELFEHGIGISKRLDKRFGRKTLAAKMTDVPGHTRGIVSLLARNDIEYLHLGKNPAVKAPDVPDLFRWRDIDGREIVVQYDKEYGTYSEIPGTGKVVYFAHTGDNAGPPAAETLNELFGKLSEEFPGASLVAADLNTVALAVRNIKDALPVFTEELGDTWIQGVGSDPRKCSGYRGLLRYCRELSPEYAESVMSRLLLIPEHTWGLDEKTHLNDTANFVRQDFEMMRREEKFVKMERSWQEQRDYLLAAVSGLRGGEYEKARELLSEYTLVYPDLSDFTCAANLQETILINRYRISFDFSGAVCRLEKDNEVFCDESHLWCKPFYEAFCKTDYDRYQSQYLIDTPEWAVRDTAKCGMEVAIDHHITAESALTGLYIKDNRIVVTMQINGTAHDSFGSPLDFATIMDFHDDCIQVDFAWWDKPATRVAEALWLGFCTRSDEIRLHKLGEWVNPLEVVAYGNRVLHAVDYGVRAGDVEIETLDAALVAPGLPSLLNFDNANPDLSKGVFFNLFNNVWATNFRMWYDEDARFRFVLHLR